MELADEQAPRSIDELPQSIDELLIAGGGYGRHQWQQAALNCGSFAACGSTLLLPNVLYPRLRVAWPELADHDTAMLTSVFFAGNFAGLAVFGAFGDSHGRRPATLASLALLILSALGGFACAGIGALVCVRAVIGFAVGGLMNSSFLLAMEVAPPLRRMRAKILLAVGGWVSGALWIALLAYLVRGLAAWQWLALYLAPTVPLLALAYRHLQESPRFLLARGRPEAALTAVHIIARTNGHPLPRSTRLAQPPPVRPSASAAAAVQPATDAALADAEDVASNSSAGSSSFATRASPAAAARGTSGARDLVLRRALELCDPTLRRRTALVGLAWFGSTCSYYGVALGATESGTRGGDLYTRQALSALLEVPAYALMGCADRMGRRTCWASFLLVAAAALLVLAWATPAATSAPKNTSADSATAVTTAASGGGGAPEWALLILSLAARFGATGASAIVYVAAAEQWPTSCRNLGINYGAACGRVGSVLAPLMKLLPMPSAILGCIGATAALAVLALPETSGQSIPETLGGVAAAAAGSVGGSGVALTGRGDVDDVAVPGAALQPTVEAEVRAAPEWLDVAPVRD